MYIMQPSRNPVRCHTCADKLQKVGKAALVYHDLLPRHPTVRPSTSSLSNMLPGLVCALSYLAVGVISAPYDPRELDWNLNTNQQTVNPLEYSGEWEGHVYTPSPSNWRFPFYTLMLDRFVNGDPTNDDINGTVFEHDVTSNQLRYGGDLAGLVDSLDYLQGMGVKVICYTREQVWALLTEDKGLYIAGTPFLNLPYKYDSYSVCNISDLWAVQVIIGILARRFHSPRSSLWDNPTMASCSQRNP